MKFKKLMKSIIKSIEQDRKLLEAVPTYSQDKLRIMLKEAMQIDEHGRIPFNLRQVVKEEICCAISDTFLVTLIEKLRRDFGIYVEVGCRQFGDKTRCEYLKWCDVANIFDEIVLFIDEHISLQEMFEGFYNAIKLQILSEFNKYNQTSHDEKSKEFPCIFIDTIRIEEEEHENKKDQSLTWYMQVLIGVKGG